MTTLTGVRGAAVRRANLSTLVREVHLAGPRSRSQLGASTGLARSAIASLVGELVAAELVMEEAPASSGSPGRPSPVVVPDGSANVVVALEIAGDSIAAAVIGLGGQRLATLRRPHPRRRAGSDRHDPADVVDGLGELAADVVAVAGAEAGRPVGIVGVGVAVVGIVARRTGTVALAPNLGWRDVALAPVLRQRLEVLCPLLVANEADLGALGEARRGAARGVSDLLFVSGELGVGGGLLVDGRPLHGVSGFGGEIGHMVVDPHGPRCHCGSVGCWETLIGEVAILRRAGRSRRRGVDAIGALADAAAHGDERAVQAIEATGTWLGVGLGSLVNVLNPGVVVLGGSFATLHPWLAGTMSAELDRRALSPNRADVHVVPSSLGTDAALIGAAELVFDEILDDTASLTRTSLRR